MRAMAAYTGVELYIQPFLTSALGAGERSPSRPARFNPIESGASTNEQ